jgi:hypothetical protein
MPSSSTVRRSRIRPTKDRMNVDITNDFVVELLERAHTV